MYVYVIFIYNVCMYYLQDRVKRRNDQITNMKATQKNLVAQLNSATATLKETNESKHVLEMEYQQFKVKWLFLHLPNIYCEATGRPLFLVSMAQIY